ncbi:MAG: MATE family efflux transporter [Helcococcus sp.]|nr:MATE family efflux transporter [Helcococcus sp.]
MKRRLKVESMKSINRKLNLTDGSILKNLILLSAPLMATSFINMAYNLTDTAWLGRLGTDAVAATGSVGYFVWMASSIADIARVGTSVFVAQEYGSGHTKRLNDTIKNGLVLLFIVVGLFTSIIIGFTDNILNFYSLTDQVHSMAKSYLTIFALGFIINGLNMTFSNIYNSVGNSFFPFVANVMGLVLNIFVDPILIFGWGPIKSLGVSGAALASVFAQLVVFIIFTVDIIKSKNEIYTGIINGKIHLDNIYSKFKKGFPVGFMSFMHSSITGILMKYMSNYGSGPIAAYSIGSMVESITWRTADGLQVGITAFTGQNFGAKLYDRLKEVIKQSMAVIVAVGLIGTFIIGVFRYQLFKIFLPDDLRTIEMGAQYLLILSMSQLGMAFEIGASGVFYGIGKTYIQSIISTVFNIARIPLSLILMPYFEYQGVWLAITISSIFKGLFAFIFLRIEYRKLDREVSK